MLPLEFQIAVSKTRLKEKSIKAAGLVLVDGFSYAEAARRVGFSLQACRAACFRVEREFRTVLGVPAGWECLTVCLPPDSVRFVKAIERRDRRRSGLCVD